MRNIINYSIIVFSFALAASFLSSTLAIDLKLKNYNESLIGFSLSFFALGVIVSSFLHNIIREKYSLFFTLVCSIFIQLLFFLLLFFQFSIFTIVIITFVMGFTNHINFLTIETYISSEFKNKSGFYISLFWSSAGFGAILGSLIIAFNGVNYLSYVIAILLIVFQFLPVFVSKSSILLTKVEKVEFSLSYNVINNIKFILICVFFLGISDAGWSSLFPSFLIEKGFADKDVGRINFTSGMLVLLIFPLIGKLIDKISKVLILNIFCLISIAGLIIFFFTENYFTIIFFTFIFYLSIGSLFLINFNLINTNLKSHLIVFGVASYSICENIGSFIGPTIIGALISFNINYFLIIFGVIFFLIFTIFNFSTKLNGGPSGT